MNNHHQRSQSPPFFFFYHSLHCWAQRHTVQNIPWAQMSCPSCVPSECLAHPQPTHCRAEWEWEKALMLCKHKPVVKTLCVISTVFSHKSRTQHRTGCFEESWLPPSRTQCSQRAIPWYPSKASRARPMTANSQQLPDNCEGQHSFSIVPGSQVSGPGLFEQGTQQGTGKKCRAKAKGKATEAWFVTIAEDMHVISLFLSQTCMPLCWTARLSADSQATPDDSDFCLVSHLGNSGRWE